MISSSVLSLISRSRCDAEEILMDVWRSVWENIKGLHNPWSLGAWLSVIATTITELNFL